MLLMIDNYDSFTFNLVQYFGELGQDVRVLRNDEIDVAGIEALQPARLVLSPGPCTPAEAGVCVAAIRHFAGQAADPRRLPGPPGHRRGARRRDRARQDADARQGQHDLGRRQGVYRGLPAQFSVIRYHSLAIERATLPADLVVTATTDDGEIMGVRHRTLADRGACSSTPSRSCRSTATRCCAIFSRSIPHEADRLAQ